MTCIELVLMKKGKADYILVQARLDDLYNCQIKDCVGHPEYLAKVLQDVYDIEYESFLDEMELETDKLGMDRFKADFFKSMKS
jgi:hypothetical protein